MKMPHLYLHGPHCLFLSSLGLAHFFTFLINTEREATEGNGSLPSELVLICILNIPSRTKIRCATVFVGYGTFLYSFDTIGVTAF